MNSPSKRALRNCASSSNRYRMSVTCFSLQWIPHLHFHAIQHVLLVRIRTVTPRQHGARPEVPIAGRRVTGSRDYVLTVSVVHLYRVEHPAAPVPKGVRCTLDVLSDDAAVVDSPW